MDTQREADTFIPTRQSLLSRLKNWDDSASWREFFNTYGELIYRLASKAGLSDAESQDVVQETMISVAKQMPGFKYDPQLGSFKGWLRQITRRRIADQMRRRLPEDQAIRQELSGDHAEDLPDKGFDFDNLWEQEWQAHLLKTALRRVKNKVRPKQFQIFDLYVTKEWPIKSVVATLGVSSAQVYMAKMRVSRILKEEIRLLQRTDII